MKKQTNPTIKAQIARSAFYLLLLLGICVIPFALANRSFDGRTTSATSSKQTERTLSFAERVAYQRAIEEVYWRHRIWPKENSKPKPPLDEVMSQAADRKEGRRLSAQLTGAGGLLATADHCRAVAG